MKIFFVAVFIALTSITSLAENRVLADIGRIANAPELQKFVEENNLQVESVNHTEVKSPIEGQWYYVVKVKNSVGRNCEVWVMAGLCSPVNMTQCNPEKITIMTESSYLKCE